MQLEYVKLGVWALSTIFLILAADAYSDVDLRIAERKVIPHYVRHQYEYADINIKQIMQQRGIVPKPYNRDTNINTGINFNRVHPVPINRNTAWRQYRKKAAESNHIIPNGNLHYLRKQKHYRDFLANNKFNKMERYW